MRTRNLLLEFLLFVECLSLSAAALQFWAVDPGEPLHELKTK